MSRTTYRSTRGGVRGASFEDVVLGGLAPDKGLYVPESLPEVSSDEIESWRNLTFAELAHRIMSKYIPEQEIPSNDLARLLEASVKNFRDRDVTPLVKVGGVWVLELFHGPTFAFKDVALQFLGNLFEYFLDRRRTKGENARLTILGATSGDTGSAAIYGLRGKKHVECFIMFPNGRVSEIQERQMTTVEDGNIHCLSVDGTFDDCQAIVKAAFNDPAFRKSVSLGAVNSINWARVLAQMTYYFWSYFRVTDESPAAAGSLNFSVPTGNFGDVLAGYYAKRMGLPLGKLLVATNENDILHRFFTSGKYWREGVVPTLSPSMDICVSSNFERYLFHLCGDDAAVLKSWFDVFEKTGKLTVNEEQLSKAQSDFISACVKTEQNLAHIKEQWDIHGYLYCPHASIGGAAVAHHDDLKREHTVVLATAHAAKFPTAVGKVVDPLPPAPEQLQALWGMPTRKVSLPNDLHAVQNHIRKTLGMPTTSKKGCSSRSLLVLAGIAAGTAVIVGLVLARRR